MNLQSITLLLSWLHEKYIDGIVREDQSALPFLDMKVNFMNAKELRKYALYYYEVCQDVLRRYQVSEYAQTPALAELFSIDKKVWSKVLLPCYLA